MTVAPRSPNIMVASGPASTRLKSATMSPDRAPGAGDSSPWSRACPASSSGGNVVVCLRLQERALLRLGGAPTYQAGIDRQLPVGRATESALRRSARLGI